jgi:hypothetical protein
MKADLGEAGQNLLIPLRQQQLVKTGITVRGYNGIVITEQHPATLHSRAYRAVLDSKWFPTAEL